jgi:ABC-type lipoprotein release transport system permease subunit
MIGDSVSDARDLIFLPMDALDEILDGQLNYIVAIFELDPKKNRELSAFREEFLEIERHVPSFFGVEFNLEDDELRMVVEQLEQNLLLLRLLYPIVMGVSLVIAFGFSVLLNIQNAKNAAVMRVLGVEKKRTRKILVLGPVVICLVGIIIGWIVFSLVNERFGVSGAVGVFGGLYLVATFAGSLVGAVVVSNRSPLDLLQVKE